MTKLDKSLVSMLNLVCVDVCAHICVNISEKEKERVRGKGGDKQRETSINDW